MIKIIDFGSSKVIKNYFEKSDSLAGEEKYRTPFQIMKVDYTVSKVDIWSIGILFYKLLTNKDLLNEFRKRYNYFIYSLILFP